MSGLMTACGAIDRANGARRSVDWTLHFSNASGASMPSFALAADEFVTGFTQRLQGLSGEFFWDEYIIGVESRDREDGDAVVR